MPLTIGQAAPAFIASDQDGREHRLGDFRNRWVLLYFYPKDDTPGCTAEACGFRDLFAELKDTLSVIGVSPDSVESHAAFVARYRLPFTLLADPERKILDAYGIGTAFKKRVSFLIDPEGVIRKIYENIDCAGHAADVRDDMRHQ